MLCYTHIRGTVRTHNGERVGSFRKSECEKNRKRWYTWKRKEEVEAFLVKRAGIMKLPSKV